MQILIVKENFKDMDKLNKLSKEVFLSAKIKRKNFYIKNGYKETRKGIYYFGVYYEILCNEDNINFELFKELMEDIKIPDFNPTFLIYNLRYKFNKMFHMKHLKFTTKL